MIRWIAATAAECACGVLMVALLLIPVLIHNGVIF